MVTIIIVNENTKDALELCLLSIKKYTEYPYKVIVIDNGSTDGSLDLLKKFNWVKVIGTSGIKDGERHGGALNIGIQYVKTKYFLTLDSDVEILDYNWLTEMIAKINKNKGVFLGEIAHAQHKKYWGKFNERCLPHCLLVRTDFFKKNNCSFMPNSSGLKSNKYKNDVGADILLKTKQLESTYCKMDQNIRNKFFHYGNVTVATLLQTKEGQEKLIHRLKNNFKFNNNETEEFKSYIEQLKREKNEIKNLIKVKIRLLKNDLKVNINYDLTIKYKYINATLKELSSQLYRIAENYFDSGNYKLCIIKLEETLFYADSSFKCKTMVKLALACSRNNMPARVRTLLSELLALNPKKIDIFYAMGSIHKENNEFDSAIKSYKKVFDFNTQLKDKFWSGAYFHLGEIYLKSGKDIQAIDNFKLCLKYNPDHKMALTYIKRHT
tara:strand:+ start:2 stop:1315 length:1314 start_codon:yes stop_codon:yes gene_type:complete